MRRILMVLTVAAIVAAMMAAGAAPAFAIPNDPVRGQQVSVVAKLYPVDPVSPGDPYRDHGKNVSLVAKGSPTCSLLICE